MFNLSKQLVVRAPKIRLTACAVSGSGQSSSLDQNSNNFGLELAGPNLNRCHKRLSSTSQSSHASPMKRLAGKVAVVTASTDG